MLARQKKLIKQNPIAEVREPSNTINNSEYNGCKRVWLQVKVECADDSRYEYPRSVSPISKDAGEVVAVETFLSPAKSFNSERTVPSPSCVYVYLLHAFALPRKLPDLLSWQYEH